MDELDHNLLMAWHRVFERCRKDPVEAKRRYVRTLPGTGLDRPNRAWCVAVRASDTRIDSACSVPDPGAVCAQAAHEIVLGRRALCALGGPVWLDYPGVPIDVAADRLGKHTEALRRWMPIQPGRTRAARAQAGKAGGLDDRLVWSEYLPSDKHPLGVRFEPQRSLGRNSGMETPVVWSDRALDPGAGKGRPPARGWGSAWMSLAERIPESFEQVVVREPRFVPYPQKDGTKHDRFRGWWYRCGGLAGRTCGRRALMLYAPLPAWTVGRMLGIEAGLTVAGLAGEWLPGVMDRWAGRRSLACARCWGVRRSTITNHTGWNDLVSHLTGGLLFGREVDQPAGFKVEHKPAIRRQRKKGKEAPDQSISRMAMSL